MNLWLIEPFRRDSGHWSPPYDKVFGVIVRASTEAQARELASKQCGEEGPMPWLDALATFCEELDSGGDAKVILVNYRSS